jgi:hypothetical protein
MYVCFFDEKIGEKNCDLDTKYYIFYAKHRSLHLFSRKSSKNDQHRLKLVKTAENWSKYPNLGQNPIQMVKIAEIFFS